MYNIYYVFRKWDANYYYIVKPKRGTVLLLLLLLVWHEIVRYDCIVRACYFAYTYELISHAQMVF